MHDIRDRVWLIPVVADGFELQRPVTAFNGLCDTGCCSFCAFPQLTIKTHLSSPSWNKLVDRKHFIIIPQFFQQQMNALSVYECVTQATLFYILLFPPVVESWYFGFLSQLYERDQGWVRVHVRVTPGHLNQFGGRVNLGLPSDSLRIPASHFSMTRLVMKHTSDAVHCILTDFFFFVIPSSFQAESP